VQPSPPDDRPVEPAVTEPDAGSAASPPETPPATTDIGSGSGSASPSDPTVVAAAHCLYVGPEERVVQCYWKLDSCEAQIAFNKESGNTRVQVCRPSSAVYCLTPNASSETCYPTAAGCDDMHGKLVARSRSTTECERKTGPKE
jgi:hypothetical protein